MKKTHTINGIEVFTKGDLTKNVLVFIHGNSLNAITFINQFNKLHSIPLVAINLPGHGNSDRPKLFQDVYCIPGYVNALKVVLQELKINSCILAGHSLGGHIAIESLNEINSIKGLFIFGTPPITIPPQMDKMFLPNPNIGLLFSGKMTEKEAKLIANELVYTHKEIVPTLSSIMLETDENARLSLGASVGEGKFKNEVELLKQCNFPIAILHGNNDSLVNLQYISDLKLPNLWQNKVHCLENTGHCPQIENTEIFNELLENYYHSVLKNNNE
ncbi:MAG: alpha/beta hydrolase [Bacteroidia bacterium]|nr:alpha/beta hydrolase [Bacteroidia bacterium]